MTPRPRRSPIRSLPLTLVAVVALTACAGAESDSAVTVSPSASDDATTTSTAAEPDTSASTTAAPPDDGPDCPAPQDGRILAIADADMVATAYTDGALGDLQPGVTDSLTVIDPSVNPAAATDTVEAPNAVTGPVWVIDTSADGRHAYVIETTQPNDAGLTRFSELYLRQGDRLTTIDLCARAGPAPTAAVETGIGPTTVSASPSGEWLAVAHRADIRLVPGVDPAAVDTDELQPGQYDVAAPAGVMLHPIEEGVVGDAAPLTLPADLLGEADEVTYAGWSPDGKTLAVAVRDTRKLGFFRANDTGNLVPWGNIVDIDEGTFGGTWSPDSRNFYVNNIRGAARPTSQTPTDFADFLGSLQTVRIGDPTSTSASHELVQTEATPIFPEGIAVSPDGTMVATVNMQSSALPASNPLFSPDTSISLWTREPESGLLTKAADTPFRGILPEGVDFDPTSSRLAVAVYQDADNRSFGYVDLWRVERAADGVPALVADQRIRAARGTHHVMWIP
jgi:hypothetical protein